VGCIHRDILTSEDGQGQHLRLGNLLLDEELEDQQVELRAPQYRDLPIRGGKGGINYSYPCFGERKARCSLREVE